MQELNYAIETSPTVFAAYMRIDTVYTQELTFINTLYFMYLQYRNNVLQAGHIEIYMHEQSMNRISLKERPIARCYV